jgi:hypothetical protein
MTQLGIDLNQIFARLDNGHIVEVIRYLDFAKERVQKLQELVK